MNDDDDGRPICGIQVTIYGYPVTAGEDWLQPRDRLFYGSVNR